MTLKWKVALILLSLVCCETMLEVRLKAPRYVLLNRNATLKCEYNVSFNHIHKVEWRKGDTKIFQYVKGRNPPFYNYTIAGGKISWPQTNETQLTLKELGFSASGVYSCRVTIDTPIYSRTSEEIRMLVYKLQKQNPKISYRKREYFVGELLEMNCTSGEAWPVPELTWLLNDTEVKGYFIRSFPEQSSRASTIQVAFRINENFNAGFNLTCLSTIPGFMGKHAARSQYADHRSESVLINILNSDMRTNRASSQHRLSTITSIIFLTKILQYSRPET